MAGNATIGALRVQLGLDSAQFEAGLKRSRSSLDGFGGSISKGLSSVFSSLQSQMAGTASKAGAVGDGLAAMGVAGAAAGVALGGVVAALAGARQAMAFGDDIADTANRLAVTTDALQEYRYAIHALGGDYNDADAALEGFSKAFGAAHAQLSAKAAKPFTALGLDPKSFSSTEAALQAVIEKIAALSSTAEQAAIADKLGLTAMLPAIRAGTAEIDRLRQAAHDLGYVMDAELVQAAGDANDKFEDLSQVIDTQFKSALVDLAPVILNLMGLTAQLARNLADTFAQFQKLEDRSTTALKDRQAALLKRMIAVQFGQGFQRPGGGGLSPVGTSTLKTLRDEYDKNAAELKKRATAQAPAVAKALAAPVTLALPKIKAGAKAANDATKDALKDLREDVQNVLDGLLSNDDRWAKTFEDHLNTLDQAFQKGLISAEQYYGALSTMAAEASGRNLKLIDPTKGVDLSNLTRPWEDAAEKLKPARSAAEDLADAFDSVSSSVGDALHALKHGDWASASSGIMNAISGIQKAWSTGGTAGKIGAVAGVAQGLGSAIGGKTGSLLGGIGGGAAAGAQLGSIIPGVGTVIGAGIGAVLGGISSLFGSSKAKKAQKAAEAKAAADKAAAEAAAEAARLQDIANTKRELEIQLLEAQGKAEEALAERRKDALAALDDSLDPLQQQLWALSDAADAAAKATADQAAAEEKAHAIAEERHGLEIALMEATGNAAGALAAKRADELAALDASNRALQQAIYNAEDFATAQEAANQAYESQLSDANDLVAKASDALSAARDREADALRSLIDRYQGYADSLRSYGKSLAGPTSGAGAAAEFARVSGLARMGNEDALQSLQSVSEAFLASSKSSAKSQLDVARDQAKVRVAVQAAADTAQRQVDINQSQLDALNTQVDALLGLNQNVVNVSGAIFNLQNALTAQLAALNAKPIVVSINGFSAPSATTLSGAGVTSIAAGDIGAPATAAGIVDEMAPYLLPIVKNTSATAKVLKQWDGDGQPEVRDVAA